MNYYNDNDPKVCAWLRELIAAGLIPAGDVDDRSILDIKPGDVAGYIQCHFFAGIGGWSLALHLAGWPEDKPVWTGSCPCQPFSVAGKQLGEKDERHLWPAFFSLIRQCRPQYIFGEQVDSAIGQGWLDGIRTDLEGEGYAIGHPVLGAHSLLAPQKRQRLYWMADSDKERWDRQYALLRQNECGREPGEILEAARGGEVGGMANTTVGGLGGDRGAQGGAGYAIQREQASSLVQPVSEGLEGYAGNGNNGGEPGRFGAVADGSTSKTSDAGGVGNSKSHEQQRDRFSEAGGRQESAVGGSGAWSDSVPILCTDGKYRRVPVEPALFPMASRLPYKLARRRSISTAILSGAGNSIVPQVAAEFIKAFMEVA